MMKEITIILILGLLAFAVILPVSAAGQNGNGKMMQTGAAPQDGTGNQYGGQAFQNGGGQAGHHGGNETCQQDCPYNQTPPQDGTGMQYGKGVNDKV